MCKVRDVALSMLQKSISLASINANRKYLMDYVKLHKMLYLSQCVVLAKYGIELFKEPISAHNCGPYIEDELDFIFNDYGAGLIDSLEYDNGQKPVVLALPYLRNEAVDDVLAKFGLLSTREIVKITKETSAYINCRGRYDDHPVIPLGDMVAVGNELLYRQT